MSGSSVIAVARPSPQLTAAARPSRATMLSSPVPPRNVCWPPPRNIPSLPGPPSKITGILTDTLTDATSLLSLSMSRASLTPLLTQSTVF